MSGSIVFSGNQRTNPRWLADFGGRETMEVFPAKLDKAAFANFYGVDILVAAGGAAIGATVIPVAAVQPPQPAIVPIQAQGSLIIRLGSIINFGQTAGKFAFVTQDVLQGDTVIHCSPLGVALVAGDDAKWDLYGNIFVPSGILVGRTFASRDSGTALFLPADPPNMDEVFLTYFDVANLEINNDCELVRIDRGVTIKENYLPGYASMSANNLAYIRAHYRCIKGVN